MSVKKPWKKSRKEKTFAADCEAINKELEGANCKVHATLDVGTSAATTTAALKALT